MCSSGTKAFLLWSSVTAAPTVAAGVSAAIGPGHGGTGSRIDMSATMMGDWRNFGAGADDRFDFVTLERTASAGLLTEGGTSLPADRLVDAMAQLAEDA